MRLLLLEPPPSRCCSTPNIFLTAATPDATSCCSNSSSACSFDDADPDGKRSRRKVTSMIEDLNIALGLKKTDAEREAKKKRKKEQKEREKREKRERLGRANSRADLNGGAATDFNDEEEDGNGAEDRLQGDGNDADAGEDVVDGNAFSLDHVPCGV